MCFLFLAFFNNSWFNSNLVVYVFLGQVLSFFCLVSNWARAEWARCSLFFCLVTEPGRGGPGGFLCFAWYLEPDTLRGVPSDGKKRVYLFLEVFGFPLFPCVTFNRKKVFENCWKLLKQVKFLNFEEQSHKPELNIFSVQLFKLNTDRNWKTNVPKCLRPYSSVKNSLANQPLHGLLFSLRTKAKPQKGGNGVWAQNALVKNSFRAQT